MFNRALCVPVLITMSLCGVGVVSAQPARPPAPPALTGLVRDAITRNLTIEGARLTPAIAAAEIQAARGTFDTQVEVQPIVGRSWQTVVTEGGALDHAFGLTALGNGSSGLVPSTGVAVGGNLRTGAQYRMSFESTRQSQSVRVLAGNLAAQFDNAMTMAVTQPLLRGRGSNIARGAIRAATIGAEGSRAGFAHVVDTTVADVENAYWTAVYARALERVIDESLGRARTLLERNEQLLGLKLVANLDVLTARQAVAVRTALLTQVRQQRAEAADAIAYLVYGREAAAHVVDNLDLDAAMLPERAPQVADVATAEADALRSRSDLREAELRVTQGRVDVELASDAVRPSLNLTGSYTALTQSTSGLRLFGADAQGDFANVGFQGGMYFTVPLGNHAAKAGLLQATLLQRQYASQAAAVQARIQQQVRQAERAIHMIGDRVRQTTDALQLAVEEYDGENQRLQLGLSDSFRLLQFEDHINEAQQAQLEARYDLALAMVAFDLARGASAENYGVAQAPVVPAP
jgi:outer membrane protein